VGDHQALVNALKRQKKDKQGDLGDEEFYVEIRSDYRISYAQVEPVMIAAAEAGFKKMNVTALVKLGEME
jgi:biopolymer transport protein ExbD